MASRPSYSRSADVAPLPTANIHINEGLPDALHQVKLLAALRSGDPALIHPFLAELARDGRKSTDSRAGDVGATALHLAIRCASYDTVSLLLSHRSISPNAACPPGSGTTPLHLAASLARVDVVNLLLEQDGIDDTLRDRNEKTCLDVAKGKDCIRAIQDSRAFLTASYRSLLRTYILSPANDPAPDALLKLLSSPRMHLVDLSFLDDSSGRTLLHEAARRKDLRLVEMTVQAGADVFARDRRGKMAYDGMGKDDRVRVFLRQFTNQDKTLISTPSSGPPELKGYLNKYTNVARGYNTRYFVLKDGVLSYSRHQEDEEVASRGSIAMKSALLTVAPNSSGLRFEIHSAPSRGHHAVQKWYLKANHPVEAARWVAALQKSMEWARREAERDGERRSGESDAASFKPPSTVGTLASAFRRRKGDSAGQVPGAPSTGASEGADEEQASEGSPRLGAESGRSMNDGNSGEEGSFAESSERVPPHSHSFELHGHSLVAQVEVTGQLLASLSMSQEPPLRFAEVKKAAEDTLAGVHGMLTEYVQMVRDREEWWRTKLDRERERQNIWEESLRAVVQEGDAMEQELRSKSRRRSRVDSSYISVREDGTLKRRASHLPLPLPLPSGLVASPEGTPSPPTAVPETPVPQRTTSLTIRQPSIPITPTGSSFLHRPRSMMLTASPPPADEEAEAYVDTDEEDEFFDAIESNTLPNLTVNESLKKPGVSAFITLSRDQYAGYLKPRDQLAITSDNRPPMSLWAVLKNSIGKDLTKISFPVFFNEPTSMLQRMAEDMEFSECLDAACAEQDPLRRIAFVAAFAMSNYSSTIGRIAKPFNPMLGETFEYVRFDKDYRYVSEQVSHHPPISACWAESPSWHYYGEVDAQNKFMGKSFEIRPTGIAHVDLLLPEHKAPRYPKAKGVNSEGKVVEHYSWTKVTTNVSGFILGSPTIDHYGEMTITNHRTNDQCVLTFKPRGWRGKDAYEISGYVMDSSGEVAYEIAGRWNSQLVARAVGTGIGQLHPDVSVGGPESPSPDQEEYILLWRNSKKPPAPFNLTPFAITLNDCPETLRPFVCPTDCRLRPDQRAFELGRYEWANTLKNKQEERQRATRRAREEGRKPPHRPRWFSAETEPDTGERVWAPSTIDDRMEYWLERDKVWKAKTAGAPALWDEVEPIFIEDEP